VLRRQQAASRYVSAEMTACHRPWSQKEKKSELQAARSSSQTGMVLQPAEKKRQ